MAPSNGWLMIGVIRVQKNIIENSQILFENNCGNVKAAAQSRNVVSKRTYGTVLHVQPFPHFLQKAYEAVKVYCILNLVAY